MAGTTLTFDINDREFQGKTVSCAAVWKAWTSMDLRKPWADRCLPALWSGSGTRKARTAASGR